MPITRINHFQAQDGKADELHAFLTGVIAVVKNCAGCLGCRLLREKDQPGHLAIIEEWESVEQHKAAASAIPPAEIVKVMPLLKQPPTGAYFLP